ncbi:RasGEF domain containing protein [Histomonas meleagridis]|uniref:RasGEF domain containing protein n=1 Tax=Histomonas meleagridis TaxID=135588 RepID=UPI00355A8298|nr:RasGEF domain containing protein [Histomonas meleagridis]KAH0801494.1 RasGEF domain containing protein [Histomonas meleagridis]
MQKEDKKSTPSSVLATAGETSSLTCEGYIDSGSPGNSFDDDLFTKQSHSLGEIPLYDFIVGSHCGSDIDDTILSPCFVTTDDESEVDLISVDNLYATNLMLNDDQDETAFFGYNQDENDEDFKQCQIFDQVPIKFLDDDAELDALNLSENSENVETNTTESSKNNDVPYTPELITVLEGMNFPKSEIDSILQVNIQRFPESSQIFLEPNGSVSCASFPQLIIALTTPDVSNVEFQTKFLISFPSFAPPYRVLACLFARFFANINCSRSNISSKKNLLLVRAIITRLLSKWLVLTKYQFTDSMINSIKTFLNVIEKDESLRVQRQIVEGSLKKFEGSKLNKIHREKEYPEMILPKTPPNTWVVTSIPPEELARQLALLHSRTYRKIKPTEVLTMIWGDNKTGGSPNINKLIHHFNLFSNFTTLTIIMPTTAQKRAEVYTFWIEVASHCLRLKNYHALFSIVFGLMHRSIERLSDTLKISLKNTKTKTTFFQLRKLCSVESNYANYRSLIQTQLTALVDPCVPFIGCFQKDLVYVQETYPNTINGLINFKKCTECVKLIDQISSFQNMRYNFKRCKQIQNIITELPPETDNVVLMKLSTTRETRRKKGRI